MKTLILSFALIMCFQNFGHNLVNSNKKFNNAPAFSIGQQFKVGAFNLSNNLK